MNIDYTFMVTVSTLFLVFREDFDKGLCSARIDLFVGRLVSAEPVFSQTLGCFEQIARFVDAVFGQGVESILESEHLGSAVRGSAPFMNIDYTFMVTMSTRSRIFLDLFIFTKNQKMVDIMSEIA